MTPVPRHARLDGMHKVLGHLIESARELAGQIESIRITARAVQLEIEAEQQATAAPDTSKGIVI